MKILKKWKKRLGVLALGPMKPKIRFLGKKLWPVACEQTDTDTKQKLETPLIAFGCLLLQPIIKERSNYLNISNLLKFIEVNKAISNNNIYLRYYIF